MLALPPLNVNLGREITLGVNLIVHIQGGVLAVAEILLGVSVVYAKAQGFFILEVRPHVLAFLSVDDGCAGVLAERKHALHGSLCVAEELQGHVFVVVRGLGVLQDCSHLLIVGAAKHELAVVERLLGYQRKGLRRYLQDGFVTEFGSFYQFFRSGNLVILRGVRAQLEHGRIFEFCHNGFICSVYKYNIFTGGFQCRQCLWKASPPAKAAACNKNGRFCSSSRSRDRRVAQNRPFL